MRFSCLCLALLLTACGEPDKPDDTAPPHPDDTAVEPTDADGDGYTSNLDCNDADPDVHPEADELCNGVNDDCDGDVDEGAIDASTWYTDKDGDGWGDPDSPVQACEQPSGTVADSTDGVAFDCDDGDASSHPGAEETCDDRADNDCDGAADEACAPPVDYPLEGADAVLYGTTEGGIAGYAVSSAGDVNGDGYDDLLVGAPDAAWEGSELEGSYEAGVRTGAAVIVPGPVTGEMDLDQAEAWLQGTYIEHVRSNADTGWSVAGVGDTNGDGFDDVLIGDPLYVLDSGTATLNYSGMAGLFLGPIEGVHDLWSADAWANGCYCSWTGYDVAGADVNGDGLADILVGTPYGCVDDTEGGSVRVMEGPLEGSLGSEDLTATLYTDVYADAAGSVVSSAGDVNGDGLDDILVGAYNDQSTKGHIGVAYLVLSPVSGTFSLLDSHLILRGGESYPRAGRALSDAGDLDGDGYDDFVLGQYDESVLAAYAGAALIYYGDAGGGLAGTWDLDSADARLSGTSEYEFAAGSVACVGDTDGDGRSDVLIGDFYLGSNGTQGTTWLVHGPIHGTWALDDVAATRFIGPNEADYAGAALSSAGDVDADGLSDILIGAPGDDTHGENAGAAYLVLAAGL